MTGKCPHCGKALHEEVPDQVSIWGMFGCHIFHKFEASTIPELIDMVVAFNKEKHPADFGDNDKRDDLGPVSLCPAEIFCGKKTLRYVGKMIFPDWATREFNPEELEAYRQALLNDPDVQRLLLKNKKISFDTACTAQ